MMDLEGYMKATFNHSLEELGNLSDWSYKIDVGFDKEGYQFNEDGSFNQLYFNNVYSKLLEIFDELIEEDFYLYLKKWWGPRYKKMDIIKRYFRTKDVTFSFQYTTEIDELFPEHIQSVYHFVTKINRKDFKYQSFFKSVIHQDFPGLFPRRRDAQSVFAYFINTDKNIIFLPYDDRGAWIFFSNEVDYKKYKVKYRDNLWKYHEIFEDEQ